MTEIWHGQDTKPGLNRIKNIQRDNRIAAQTSVDCRGLYDSTASPVVDSLTDMSMQPYLIALRESMRIDPLSEI